MNIFQPQPPAAEQFHFNNIFKRANNRSTTGVWGSRVKFRGLDWKAPAANVQ
jgi:hypothetical protein